MVTAFASNWVHTQWILGLWSNANIKQLRRNNPTFDREDLLWQEARSSDEGQKLELAPTKPNMAGHLTDIAESNKEPTIDETKLSVKRGKRGAANLPTISEFLTAMARTMARSQSSGQVI